VPRSLIVDPAFSWHDDARPRYRFADTVVYEAHEAAIAHLLDLGVTTVELLPVHQSVPESFLPERSMVPAWSSERPLAASCCYHGGLAYECPIHLAITSCMGHSSTDPSPLNGAAGT
jgi:hypothetical protein